LRKKIIRTLGILYKDNILGIPYKDNTLGIAYKDNTLGIPYKDNYHSRMQEFLDSNSFTVLKTEPMNSFQSRKMALLRATAGNEVQKLAI